MPSSKEVRARQQRQKERIATQHAERLRTRERRRRIGLMAIVLVVVAGVGLALAFGPNNGSSGHDKVANVPTTPYVSTPSTTAAALESAKGKPCVGLKSALPKGSPSFTVPAGPAPTTLMTKDLKVGTGVVIPANATVSVNYVGVACSTGKIFDSSYSRNQAFDANLKGGVIQGWIKGVPGMRIGGVRLLSIPAGLAYGATGSPPTIAPDEALFFLVAPVKLG